MSGISGLFVNILVKLNMSIFHFSLWLLGNIFKNCQFLPTLTTTGRFHKNIPFPKVLKSPITQKLWAKVTDLVSRDWSDWIHQSLKFEWYLNMNGAFILFKKKKKKSLILQSLCNFFFFLQFSVLNIHKHFRIYLRLFNSWEWTKNYLYEH